MVQTFYANLSFDDNNVIHSRVGSVDVTLSVDDIALIRALPNERLDIFSEHLNSFQMYPEGESSESSLLIHNNGNQALTLNDKVSSY